MNPTFVNDIITMVEQLRIITTCCRETYEDIIATLTLPPDWEVVYIPPLKMDNEPPQLGFIHKFETYYPIQFQINLNAPITDIEIEYAYKDAVANTVDAITACANRLRALL